MKNRQFPKKKSLEICLSNSDKTKSQVETSEGRLTSWFELFWIIFCTKLLAKYSMAVFQNAVIFCETPDWTVLRGLFWLKILGFPKQSCFWQKCIIYAAPCKKETFKWNTCQRPDERIKITRRWLMTQQNLKPIFKFWILKGLINQSCFF